MKQMTKKYYWIRKMIRQIRKMIEEARDKWNAEKKRKSNERRRLVVRCGIVDLVETTKGNK